MNPESADVRLENMQQLCRVCAGSEGPLVSVFGEEGNRQFLADKIHTVLPIMVTPGDWLPQRVCIMCVTALDACHSLLNTCLEADIKLRAILETCRAESGKMGPCLDEVTHWTDLRTDSLSHSSLLTEVISDVENIIMDKPRQPVNGEDHRLLTNADLTVDLISGNSITAIDTDNHQILRLDDNIIDEVVINTYVDLSKSSESILLDKEIPLQVEASQEVCTSTHKTKITGSKKADSKKLKLDCSSCDFSTDNEKDLKKHGEVQHNTQKRHSCTECFRVFSSATRLKEHRRRHTGELPFICEFCGKMFRLSQMLKEHLFQHGAGPHTYSCTECGKEFASRRCFKEHQETHSTRRIQCSICGKCLKGRSSYAKHQKTHVPFEAPTELKCNFCGKEHRSKQLLAEHLRTHTGERPYSCPSCKKRFAIRKTLMNHMLTHSDERKHACEVCDFRSNRRSNLLIHMKTQSHWRNQAAGVGGTVKWVAYVQPPS